MSDLLIRGGLVVDGTGTPARAADVRVRDGRIAEIGPGLRPDGERVLDAGGGYVTPGSSTSTRTSTPRCSGTRCATRCRSTA
jgi:N-acyl-D-aspartate/D-glutamate deacylase